MRNEGGGGEGDGYIEVGFKKGNNDNNKQKQKQKKKTIYLNNACTTALIKQVLPRLRRPFLVVKVVVVVVMFSICCWN